MWFKKNCTIVLEAYALHCACAVQANQAYKQICANSKGAQCDIGQCGGLGIQMKHKDFMQEKTNKAKWAR